MRSKTGWLALLLAAGVALAPGGVRAQSMPGGGENLDLARQGDLDWTIKAGDLESEGGRWIFDGAPVVEGDRVYVALRRCDPQLQLTAASNNSTSAACR